MSGQRSTLRFWEGGGKIIPQKKKLLGDKYFVNTYQFYFLLQLNITWVWWVSHLPHLLSSSLTQHCILTFMRSPFPGIFTNWGQKYYYYSEYMNFSIQRQCDSAETELMTATIRLLEMLSLVHNRQLWGSVYENWIYRSGKLFDIISINNFKDKRKCRYHLIQT